MKDDTPSFSEERASPQSVDADWRARLAQLRYILWERRWIALTAVLVTAVAGFAWLISRPSLYEATATLQVLRRAPAPLRSTDLVDSVVASDADFNTQIKLLDSVAIAQGIVPRLSPSDIRALLAPYETSSKPLNPVDIVVQGRRTQPMRLTLVAAVSFRHPDPRIAALVANLLAAEFIAYNTRQRIEDSMRVVDDLRSRAELQRKRVDEIAAAQQSFRQRGNLVSLAQNKDIVTERLKALNMMATETQARLKDAEVRWRQVREWTDARRDLSELPFIASQSKVNQLVLEITRLKLGEAQLAERYQPGHPKMIEATNAVAQAQGELQAALATAAAAVRAEYEGALRRDEEARGALAAQEAKSLELDKFGLEYENLDREFRVNNQLLETMIARIRETAVTGNMEIDSARIIDRAVEPSSPSSPRRLELGALIFAGSLFAGLAVALVAHRFDGRLLSVTDIESELGMPLLGTVPRGERPTSDRRARLGVGQPELDEAFLALAATLAVNPDSATTTSLLVTSTIPAEGKSFVATNLALTFAAQGLRTVLVDFDLRRPTLEATFALRPAPGASDFCLRNTPLDALLQRAPDSTLHLISAGTGHRNPFELLQHPRLAQLFAELSRQFDRVVVDSPPLGAVTDALLLLPHLDGAVYVARFNQARREEVTRQLRRLAAPGRPIHGLVFNDVTAAAANAYFGGDTGEYYRTYYRSAPTTPPVSP